MSTILVQTATPGLSAANSIMGKIKSIGIQDVELMFDKDIKMWAVVQVFRPSGRILTMNTNQAAYAAPNVMWWCKTPQGTYRDPGDQDLSDIVVTVKRAAVVFEKGSDWLVDQIEAKEQKTYDDNKTAQSERIRSFAKPLKKAIRRELT